MFRQYYFYARGDAVAGLWPRRHALRYGVYVAGACLALIGGWAWLLVAVGVMGYCRAPWVRVSRRHHEGHRLAQSFLAAVLVPVVRIVGDIAKMTGYPAGFIRVWRTPTLRRDRDAWRARFL